MLFTTGIVFNENDWSGEDMIDEDKMRAIETEAYLERHYAPAPISEDKLLYVSVDCEAAGTYIVVTQKECGELERWIYNDYEEASEAVKEALRLHRASL